MTIKGASDEGLRVCARLAGKREDDGTVWQQIAYAGEWQGHGAGSFKLTLGIFKKALANFKRREDDLPVIHGHPGVGSAEAAYRGVAGWISELQIDKDDKDRPALFARTKWTKRTAQMIGDDEIRYCSIVIAFNSVDEVTGEEIGPELLELGVVPAAFLDGMTRLAASREGRKTTCALAQKGARVDLNYNEILKRAQKELPEGFSRDQLVAFIDAEEMKASAIEGAPKPDEEPAEEDAPEEVPVAASLAATGTVEDPPAKDAPEEEASARDMGADWLEAFAAEMGLDLPALLSAMDESRDALASALGAAPEEGTPADDMAAMSRSHTRMLQRLDASESRVTELGKSIAERDKKLEALGFEVELSKAIADGVVTDATADEIREFAADSLTLARKQLAKRVESPEVPRGRSATNRAPQDSEMSFSQRVDALTDNQRVYFETFRGGGDKPDVALSKAIAGSN